MSNFIGMTVPGCQIVLDADNSLTRGGNGAGFGFLKKKVKKLTGNFTSNRIRVCVRPL